MPKRGENIFKRKDGRWEARYIHHYENGKAVYKYIYGKTYSEAKAKKLAAQQNADFNNSTEKIQNAKIYDVCELWLQSKKNFVKESTYSRYYRVIAKYVIPSFGSAYICEIGANHINKYISVLLNERMLAPKTVQDIICIIKAIYKFAAVEGISCQDISSIRYPQKKARNIKIINEKSRIRLEKVLFSTDTPTATGILFALYTGVRIGELCGIRWGDIDFETGTVKIIRTVERISDLAPNSEKKTKIIITEPKTADSLRIIPLPEFLTELLKLRRCDDCCYLITGSEKFTEPHQYYIRYKKFLKRNNFEDYTFHALRHTFATRCVELEFDTKSLSEILGHSSVTTTLSFYVHPTLRQKKMQMNRFSPCFQEQS